MLSLEYDIECYISKISMIILEKVITIYEYITLPIYYLIQQPWNNIEAGAKEEAASGYNSLWTNSGEGTLHKRNCSISSRTIADTVQKSIEYYGVDTLILGINNFSIISNYFRI